MKARKNRIEIKDGKVVTFMRRPALTVNGVVVTPEDHSVILQSIRSGDKD
jgi:hypothetical protein